MSQIYKTISIRQRLSKEELAFWEVQFQASNSLHNSTLYLIRTRHFDLDEQDQAFSYWRNDELRPGRKLRKVSASYERLCNDLKEDENYKVLFSQAAQQTIKSVVESIKSFNSLVDLFFEGELHRPSIPKYRKSGGFNQVTYPSQHLKYEDGYLVFPQARDAKSSLLCEIKLEMPHFISFDWMKEVRVRPSRGEIWVDWVIDDGKEEVKNNPNLDYNEFLSIDHGVKFWLSAVTTKGRSFIVEAPQLKTALFRYQEEVAKHKEGKPQKYWDEYLDGLTSKHNLRVRDAVNKATRFIINRCLKDGIGNLVMGWNKGNKQNINIGKKNNYEVVSMPTARLIKRLEELCKEYGIILHVISEEYTSKASFLDRDKLHNYGEKPVTWKPSGKRITRDQYRSKSGLIVHADINAAANILRRLFKFLTKMPNVKKHKILKKLDGVLTDPKRYDIFMNMKKKYRKQTSRRTVLTDPSDIRLESQCFQA